MIGAALYSYKSNFSGDEPAKRPYASSVKLRLVDIIRPGYIRWSKYNEDLFIGLCQWLMIEGYPLQLTYDGNIETLRQFVADALFSVDLFHVQSLHINCDRFDLIAWQKEFRLFELVEIPVKYYRNRASVPIRQFEQLCTIENLLYMGRSRNGDTIEALSYSPNKRWRRAKWILDRCIKVNADILTYCISYGCLDDLRDFKKGKAHSSWTVSIDSHHNENYIDFCIRLFDNYSAIINGTYPNE